MPGGAHENMRAWSFEEDLALLHGVKTLGTRWTDIAKTVNNENSSTTPRTVAMVRNRYLRIRKGKQATDQGMAKRRCTLCGELRRGHLCQKLDIMQTAEAPMNKHDILALLPPQEAPSLPQTIELPQIPELPQTPELPLRSNEPSSLPIDVWAVDQSSLAMDALPNLEAYLVLDCPHYMVVSPNALPPLETQAEYTSEYNKILNKSELQTPPTSPRPCEDKMVREEKEDDDISDLLVLLAD